MWWRDAQHRSGKAKAISPSQYRTQRPFSSWYRSPSLQASKTGKAKRAPLKLSVPHNTGPHVPSAVGNDPFLTSQQDWQSQNSSSKANSPPQYRTRSLQQLKSDPPPYRSTNPYDNTHQRFTITHPQTTRTDRLETDLQRYTSANEKKKNHKYLKLHSRRRLLCQHHPLSSCLSCQEEERKRINQNMNNIHSAKNTKYFQKQHLNLWWDVTQEGCGARVDNENITYMTQHVYHPHHCTKRPNTLTNTISTTRDMLNQWQYYLKNISTTASFIYVNIQGNQASVN